MKAILEFNLPEETDEHSYAINGAAYRIVIEAVLEHIRRRLKYEDQTVERQQVYEELRAVIIEELYVRGLND